MRLGFACNWKPDRASTWSGTPLRLYDALSDLADVVDIDCSPNRATRFALAGMNTRIGDGRRTSMWTHSRAGRWVVERTARRGVDAAGPDAVLQIGDLASYEIPFGQVQDLNFSLLMQFENDIGFSHFPGLSRKRARELQERQMQISSRAANLFPMSRWLADSLIKDGARRDRITVIVPGALGEPSGTSISERVERKRTKVLFVGRDFRTKGGEQVVSAFSILRGTAGLSNVELTVIGPDHWPLSEAIPDGVTFRGPQPHAQVIEAMRSHDLFVMPSHFEGFGIVFAEALIQGLPCVGRNRCAMPEIITQGKNGSLITGDSPRELAHCIEELLQNQSVYETTALEVGEMVNRYSWSRAAAQIVEAMESGSR